MKLCLYKLNSIYLVLKDIQKEFESVKEFNLNTNNIIDKLKDDFVKIIKEVEFLTPIINIKLPR